MTVWSEPNGITPVSYTHLVPITDHGKLVGIITNRDIRFETNYNKKITEVMTKEPLITAPVGTTLMLSLIHILSFINMRK